MSQESRYLIIKTRAIILKLIEKYENIIVLPVENNPGNLRIQFKSWSSNHRFPLILSRKSEQTFSINNFLYKIENPNNNFYKEFESICIVIDKLIINYNKKFNLVK